MKEELSKSQVQVAVFEFLRNRTDALVFGAQAVNALVAEGRFTEDVDVMSTRGVELAEEIREFLHDRFHIAARVRNVRDGLGYRVYQRRKEGNRHLVDVRPVKELPPSVELEGVLILAPAEMIAAKITSFVSRKGKPKAGSDWRDLGQLLITFPQYRVEDGEVREILEVAEAEPAVLALWSKVVEEGFQPDDEDSEFDW